MLDRIEGVPGCLFAAVPDVVGDADATAEMWTEWSPEVIDRGLPAAWVAQDGATDHDIPEEAAAVFIGGTTNFKLGQGARDIVREASGRGMWVHVGRVNTYRRLRYCQSIGADSVDGSKWPMFKDQCLAGALVFLAGGEQMSLMGDACQ